MAMLKSYNVSAANGEHYLGGIRKACNRFSARLQIANDFEERYGTQPSEVIVEIVKV